MHLIKVSIASLSVPLTMLVEQNLAGNNGRSYGFLRLHFLAPRAASTPSVSI